MGVVVVVVVVAVIGLCMVGFIFLLLLLFFFFFFYLLLLFGVLMWGFFKPRFGIFFILSSFLLKPQKYFIRNNWNMKSKSDIVDIFNLFFLHYSVHVVLILQSYFSLRLMNWTSNIWYHITNHL